MPESAEKPSPASGIGQPMAVNVTMIRSYGWQRFYEAAIIETDPARLPFLIQSAQAALDARIEQIRANHNGNHTGADLDESHAIADALLGLRMLREETKAS